MAKTLIYLIFISIPYLLTSQDDPVLFTIDDTEVLNSEFEYIYSKNNGDKADYSEESLREYLDLYINFKLKVAKARERQIDTLPSYIEELAGYRRQLADSYIVEKELAERIAREAFDRMQKDVAFSHILVRIERKATFDEDQKAQAKINMVFEKLQSGRSFESLAKEYSEDKNTKDKGGKVGYMTAILPEGYYELENALYNTPKGKYSKVLRSNLGYHIVKVNDTRPARGRLSAAHILIRKKYKGVENPNAKEQIENVYKELKNGASFENLVAQKSQDNNTKEISGKLGEFGIGQFEKSFEDAAYALKKDGDFSPPIETSIGYHIIRRLNLKEPNDYHKIATELIKKTNRGERQEAAKKALNKEIKEEAGFKYYAESMDEFVSKLDDSFYQYSWIIPELSKNSICDLGDEKYNLDQFAIFCKKRGRLRMQHSNEALPEAALELLNEFISEKTIDYQQERLEEKYIDFRNLMREYTEGILLFEITKNEVWDKASKDEKGIEKYYQGHKENYFWNKRAKVTNYSLRSTDLALVDKVLKKAAKTSEPDKVAKAFNGSNGDLEIVMYTEEVIDQEDNKSSDIEWNKGSLTAPQINNALKMTTFFKVNEILPRSQKSLADARGYVISDYQQYLEKMWIAELKEQYEVKINENVLQQLVK